MKLSRYLDLQKMLKFTKCYLFKMFGGQFLSIYIILIGFIYNKYFKKQVEYNNKYTLAETYSNEYK